MSVISTSSFYILTNIISPLRLWCENFSYFSERNFWMWRMSTRGLHSHLYLLSAFHILLRLSDPEDQQRQCWFPADSWNSPKELRKTQICFCQIVKFLSQTTQILWIIAWLSLDTAEVNYLLSGGQLSFLNHHCAI
jgi:hypothetical protein